MNIARSESEHQPIFRQKALITVLTLLDMLLDKIIRNKKNIVIAEVLK